jgi:hypothetical protein
MSFCHRKVGLICLILENVIPKDDLIWMPAYARLWNQYRVSLKNVSRFYLHRKVGLTSSCALGGLLYPGRSEACLTTLFSEFCHLKILVRGRQSCEERAARDLRLCDEACDLLQFWETLAPSCFRGQACAHSSREAQLSLCGEAFLERMILLRMLSLMLAWELLLMHRILDAVRLCRN